MEKSPYGGYYYLSKEDSLLYDEIKDSADKKDQTIKKLLEDKAIQSRNAYCNSRY